MKIIISALLAGALAYAQTDVGGRNFKGRLDATAAPSTAPFTTGLLSARPSACTRADVYFSTDATPGSNLSLCTTTGAPGTWTVVTISGGTWGSISGTLSDQTDLGTALALKLAKASNLSDLTSASTARTNLGLGTAAVAASSDFAAASHTHAAADVISGQFDIARLASGTPNGAKFVRDDGVLATPAGGGDVSGPSSATDNCFARFDGTTGKTIQNSVVCADDSGNITGAPSVSTGDGTTAGSFSWFELVANGTNFRKWLAPDALTASLTMTYADAVPTAGQVMRFGAPSVNVSAQTWGDASGVGACSANTWASTLNNNAAPTCTQPAFSNLSGAATASQLPNPGASSKGGVNSKTCTSGDFVSTIGTDASITCTTPASGGSSGIGAAWGYDGGTSVTTSATTLCTLSVPAGTLGTGGASGHALVMRFVYVNNTASGNISLAINYGSSSHTIVSGSGTNSSTYVGGEYILANDLGVTNAQSLIFVSQSKTSGGVSTGAELDQSVYEPNQNSASGTLDFSLKATAASTTQTIRVFMCSIKLL